MSKLRYLSLSLSILLLICLLPSCSLFTSGSKNPIIVTLWHNYGGQMKETMDLMIDEFNSTIGADEGVFVNVTSISGSDTLHEKLLMAAKGEPGAPPLPDITTAYPKTAIELAKRDLLVDLEQYFSDQELSSYIDEFLMEGQLNDILYVLPTAKSTEVLFLNATIFNRFAMDTGVTIDDLASFEGIARLSALYYEWTDNQTPDIENDGKFFYMPDSLFNFSFIGCKQLGQDFFIDRSLNLQTDTYKRIWDLYIRAASQGHFAIFDGFATDLVKTGDLVCSTGSTAGILFFPPNVTYEDNTSEPIDLLILPYPVFNGGSKVAIQRGGGMCISKSNKDQEEAAASFLKWFTEAENNLRFVSSTGYLPVTSKAFEDLMTTGIKEIENERNKRLLEVSRQMQKDYELVVTPVFEDLAQLQDTYEASLIEIASKLRAIHQQDLTYPDNENPSLEHEINKAYKALVDEFANN